MIFHDDFVRLSFIVRLCNLGIIDKQFFEAYGIYQNALRGMADLQCKSYAQFDKHYKAFEIGLYELYMDLKNKGV